MPASGIEPSTAAAGAGIQPAPGSPTPPSGPVVAQIQFYGLDRVPEERVRSLLKVREWTPYPPEMRFQDENALLDSGWFAAVSIHEVALSSTAVRIDIRVKEGTPPPLEPPAASPPPPERLPGPAMVPIRTSKSSSGLPEPPWVVGELEIEGLKNVKYNVVRGRISARKGDLYTRGDLDRDIQKILKLGNFDRAAADISSLPDQELPVHFSEVSGSTHPVKLVFLLHEKPSVNKIFFEGRKRLSKGKLRDELELRRRDPLDRVKLREDKERLIELYKKKGFHRVAIETKVAVDTAAHKADITYLITEGPKARIAAVNITGAKVFKPKKVARRMKNRRKKIFNEAQLEEDFKKVESFYKDRGYIDYRLESSSITYSEDLTKIYINMTLREGPQYRFGESRFSGSTIYVSSELAKALEYREGRIFKQKKFEWSIQNLQEMFAEKGRLRAVVEPEKTYNEDTKLMDVLYRIREGKTVYVDHVDVEGFKSTKKYVFTRELVIMPGMPFSVSKVRRSREKIMNLGFIDDVELDIQSPFDPNLVDLTFGVTEGKPGMLTAGAGFSSLDGLVGTVSLSHMNLFGRAWRTSVQWSFGSRVNDYSVSWTTPWVGKKPVSLGFDVFNTRRISPFEGSGSAFVNKRLGGTVRVGPRFKDDKYRLNTSYTFQKVSILNVQERFKDSLSEGTSVHSLASVELARDTRDNIWDPSRGSKNSVGMTLSGGPFMGDIHYWKPYISDSIHWTVGHIGDWPMVLSASNRAGYVTPFDKTKDVPVFERFFIGGQDSLRGYSVTGEVGARNGGKVYDVCNVELGFPLARERRRTIVKFVTFFDAGSSWENVRSMHARVGSGERDIKTDVGFGIRFTTPAFPIRLDWGYGLQHRAGEDRTQINFSIGPMF